MELSGDQILEACNVFTKKYANDVSSTIRKFRLEEIFSSVCIGLRMFCTLPVTVASAERSFNKLRLVKNFLRSTMPQEKLNDLATLSIKAKIARCVDFQDIICHIIEAMTNACGTSRGLDSTIVLTFIGLMIVHI